MKKFLVFGIVLLFFGFTPSAVNSQTARRPKAKIVKRTKVTRVGPRKRTVRRVRRRTRRRTHRRIYRRTLRSLPRNTRVVRHRRVAYYPINGVYYIKNNGAYVGVVPPIGFRVARIPWTLTRLTVANRTYHYANGVYYSAADDGYEIVESPIGAKVDSLPEEVEEVYIDGELYYSFDGDLYSAEDDMYELMGYEEEEEQD